MTKTKLFLKRLGLCLSFLTIPLGEAQATAATKISSPKIPKASVTQKISKTFNKASQYGKQYGKKAWEKVKKIPNQFKKKPPASTGESRAKTTPPERTSPATQPTEQSTHPAVAEHGEQSSQKTQPLKRSASFTQPSETHPKRYPDELRLPDAPTETPGHADAATDIDERLNRLTDGGRGHKVASVDDIQTRLNKLKNPSPGQQGPRDPNALEPAASHSHQPISDDLEAQLANLPAPPL